MAAFSEALIDCGLTDLGFEGRPFTWSNNQKAPRTVRCRLDRVCANQPARQCFPDASVTHIDQPGSDHIPILLKLTRINSYSNPRCRPFRFEALWVRKDGCQEIVERIWEWHDPNSDGTDMLVKGEECRAKLMQWSRDINPNKLIDRLQQRIMELRHGAQTEERRNEISQLTIDLEKLLQDQADYWRQRGKAAWMKDGDKNTAYFHARATTRKQVNKIKGLQDATGVWVSSKGKMEAVVDGYFS